MQTRLLPGVQARQQVRVDRKEVPHQRRSEVGPEPTLARVRDQPEEEPDAAQVDQWEQPTDHQGEGRDDFRAPRDGSAPRRVHQPKDRRDQRTRMTDSDPENEVDEIEPPEDR